MISRWLASAQWLLLASSIGVLVHCTNPSILCPTTGQGRKGSGHADGGCERPSVGWGAVKAIVYLLWGVSLYSEGQSMRMPTSSAKGCPWPEKGGRRQRPRGVGAKGRRPVHTCIRHNTLKQRVMYVQEEGNVIVTQLGMVCCVFEEKGHGAMDQPFRPFPLEEDMPGTHSPPWGAHMAKVWSACRPPAAKTVLNLQYLTFNPLYR